jgi:hypothetical protein
MMKFVVHHNICTSKGNLKFAMDTYEKILESSNCNSDLQSIVYRQLGGVLAFLSSVECYYDVCL